MTPHKVECFRNNGEPYGRYVNPFIEDILPNFYKKTEQIISANTFPFPSGTIGRTYDREEVEVIEQIFTSIGEWLDIANINPEHLKGIQVVDSERRIIGKYTYRYRQIFRLIPPPVDNSKSSDSCNQRDLLSENGRQSQPIEKEPETVQQAISSRQYIEQVYGIRTFERALQCKDDQSIMDMMDDFLDWAVKKQQEASQ